jgi:hypothetical protein
MLAGVVAGAIIAVTVPITVQPEYNVEAAIHGNKNFCNIVPSVQQYLLSSVFRKGNLISRRLTNASKRISEKGRVFISVNKNVDVVFHIRTSAAVLAIAGAAGGAAAAAAAAGAATLRCCCCWWWSVLENLLLVRAGTAGTADETAAAAPAAAVAAAATGAAAAARRCRWCSCCSVLELLLVVRAGTARMKIRGQHSSAGGATTVVNTVGAACRIPKSVDEPATLHPSSTVFLLLSNTAKNVVDHMESGSCHTGGDARGNSEDLATNDPHLTRGHARQRRFVNECTCLLE